MTILHYRSEWLKYKPKWTSDKLLNSGGESVPGRIEHVEKAEPASPAGPWPPSYLHERSELDDLCKHSTQNLGLRLGLFHRTAPASLVSSTCMYSTLLVNYSFRCSFPYNCICMVLHFHLRHAKIIHTSWSKFQWEVLVSHDGFITVWEDEVQYNNTGGSHVCKTLNLAEQTIC